MGVYRKIKRLFTARTNQADTPVAEIEAYYAEEAMARRHTRQLRGQL